MTGETLGILEIVRHLDAVLGANAFSRHSATQWLGGRGFDRWVRERSWKRDVFEIDYPRSSPLHVGAKVLVRILAPSREVTADAASVAYLAGRTGDYLPAEYSEASEFLRIVQQDAVHAIGWFEQYRSPESSLERLKTASRNGCGKGTVPYEAAVAFLASHTAV